MRCTAAAEPPHPFPDSNRNVWSPRPASLRTGRYARRCLAVIWRRFWRGRLPPAPAAFAALDAPSVGPRPQARWRRHSSEANSARRQCSTGSTAVRSSAGKTRQPHVHWQLEAVSLAHPSDGSQTISSACRGDCITGTAWLHAFSSRLLHQDAGRRIAKTWSTSTCSSRRPARRSERSQPFRIRPDCMGRFEQALLVPTTATTIARLMLGAGYRRVDRRRSLGRAMMIVCSESSNRRSYGFLAADRRSTIDQRPLALVTLRADIKSGAALTKCYLWPAILRA